MPQGKRKRSGEGLCTLFPDEQQHGGRKSMAGAPPEPSSLHKAWERCGEGFDGFKAEKGARKTLATRHLAQSFVSNDVLESLKEQADIVWSDSDLSNDGSKEFHSQNDDLGKFVRRVGKNGCDAMSVPVEGYSGEDSPQIIDDHDASDHEGDLFAADESAVEISDSESVSSDVSKTLLQSDKEAASAIDIAEYSSDDLDESVSLVERSPCLVGDGDTATFIGKSASDWARTAQVLLQTPEKTMTKNCKTPDDSAKKRRRFLGGGLAERLIRLQNRERSAISFWRHQHDSDCKMPLGDKSGILMLRIIEIHEECSMQVALCEKLVDPPNVVTSSTTDSSSATILKVLFTHQTASQLQGQPCDIIYIHPPWLNLTLRDENTPVLLNTHFTQKIIRHLIQDDDKTVSSLLPERRKPVPLSVVLNINNDAEIGGKRKCEDHPNTYSSQEQARASSFSVNDSLLDVVETQGAAGWKEMCIRVVIQRVYGLPSRASPRSCLQGSSKASLVVPVNPSRLDIRLCLLIQDAYGIFSELQLQCNNPSPADIECYSKRWEGKACCLSGMKILQRTTRGRSPGLFSLIDSLWPPLLPIKIHGQSQDQGQVQTNLPAPSFCYILAVHHDERGDNIREEDKISDFYLPPVVHSLEEILQVVGLNQRCSFWATVIYVKPEQMHGDFPFQKDIWMFVTDVTLQGTIGNSMMPRVLAVCVSPSCVLEHSIMHTLCEQLPCAIWFKDAVKENGRIICIERTVLSLQKPLLSCAAGANELTGPVILDELDSRMEANSLCFVKGVIVGVNERASFSWPVCNKCGSNRLQRSAESSFVPSGFFFCNQCSQVISCPIIKMQLEISLHSELIPDCKVKLKLLQDTISVLLNLCSSKDGRYEVSGMIGKEVGPLDCYVQSWSSPPNSIVALKEICLERAGSS
ncbi:Hypothetical predicted protein [Pelobates cultripes]|uniref:Scaffold protein involved in DNA repair n=1 Tax=Pelobates cultripes TaxID=61616 RepID=A0AAD1S2M7_PELCU|nr:Hypothetical predicted protein [Pelobates cultripes]